MKILYKLLSGFLFVALLSSIVAYFGMDTINSIDQSYNSVEDKTLPVIDSLEEMRYSGIEIASHTEELISKPENETLENDKNKLKRSIEKFNASFKKYEELVNQYFPDETEYLGKINTTGQEIKEISGDLVRLKTQDSSEEEIHRKFEEFEEVEDDFLGSIEIALDKENEEFAERSIELESTIVEAKNTILIVSLLTLFTAIVIGSIVSRSISDPIVKLKDAADEIDRGNLKARADIKSGDEIGVLSSTFNKMVKDLSEEISGHKQTVENLKQRNEFVKTVLESLSYPFYVINVNDYSIALANSAACKDSSAEGSNCYALMHKSDKPCGTENHRCPLEEVKTTGKPVVIEHIHYDKDGNVRNMEVHCYPIFDRRGKVVQVIEYSIDITERKEFEAVLAESEERYRTIVEQSNDLIWSLDKEGNFRFVNKRAEKITGYRAADWLGRSFAPLINSGDLPRIMKIFQKALKGNSEQYELTIKRNDGSDLVLSVNSAPYYSKGEIDGVISFAKDITESKHAEKALVQSEEKYRTLFESSSDAVIMLDENGLFDCNNATLQMFGSSKKEDFLKYHTSDVSPPYQPDGMDSLTSYNNKIEEAFRNGTNRFEWVHRKKNGEDFPAEVLLTAFYLSKKHVLQANVRDISDRKRAEVALVESEERFRSVAQSASDPMITSDSSGHIIFWNLAAEKKFGYKNDEILGKPLTILMPERYYEAHLNGFKRLCTTGESHVIGNTVELVAMKKNGGEFPIELSLSKWNHRGKIFFSGIMRDITERKRNEEIRIENERLALSNKAKSEFLTIMSHELRTPLNAILGFSELIKNKNAGELNEKQIRYADNIHSSGKHLLNLIDDILDLTKIESGKTEVIFENMFVSEAIDESVEMIREQAAKQNIELKKQITADIEFIETDRNKFRQVLNNLLGNAVKFSKSEGGTITIIAEKEKDMAKFSISDTGIGIKEEDMGKLFQSFEQLDVGIARKYEGTGLGLSVSKKIVELLGGRITAESRYGEGSTFTFYLPIQMKNKGE